MSLFKFPKQALRQGFGCKHLSGGCFQKAWISRTMKGGKLVLSVFLRSLLPKVIGTQYHWGDSRDYGHTSELFRREEQHRHLCTNSCPSLVEGSESPAWLATLHKQSTPDDQRTREEQTDTGRGQHARTVCWGRVIGKALEYF